MHVVLIILFSVFAFVKICLYNNFHVRQEVKQQNALVSSYYLLCASLNDEERCRLSATALSYLRRKHVPRFVSVVVSLHIALTALSYLVRLALIALLFLCASLLW